jgi:hypothetical protein
MLGSLDRLDDCESSLIDRLIYGILQKLRVPACVALTACTPGLQNTDTAPHATDDEHTLTSTDREGRLVDTEAARLALRAAKCLQRTVGERSIYGWGGDPDRHEGESHIYHVAFDDVPGHKDIYATAWNFAKRYRLQDYLRVREGGGDDENITVFHDYGLDGVPDKLRGEGGIVTAYAQGSTNADHYQRLLRAMAKHPNCQPKGRRKGGRR